MVGGSISDSFSLIVQVFMGKILKTKLFLMAFTSVFLCIHGEKPGSLFLPLLHKKTCEWINADLYCAVLGVREKLQKHLMNTVHLLFT